MKCPGCNNFWDFVDGKGQLFDTTQRGKRGSLYWQCKKCKIRAIPNNFLLKAIYFALENGRRPLELYNEYKDMAKKKRRPKPGPEESKLPMNKVVPMEEYLLFMEFKKKSKQQWEEYRRFCDMRENLQVCGSELFEAFTAFKSAVESGQIYGGDDEAEVLEKQLMDLDGVLSEIFAQNGRRWDTDDEELWRQPDDSEKWPDDEGQTWIDDGGASYRLVNSKRDMLCAGYSDVMFESVPGDIFEQERLITWDSIKSERKETRTNYTCSTCKAYLVPTNNAAVCSISITTGRTTTHYACPECKLGQGRSSSDVKLCPRCNEVMTKNKHNAYYHCEFCGAGLQSNALGKSVENNSSATTVSYPGVDVRLCSDCDQPMCMVQKDVYVCTVCHPSSLADASTEVAAYNAQIERIKSPKKTFLQDLVAMISSRLERDAGDDPATCQELCALWQGGHLTMSQVKDYVHAMGVPYYNEEDRDYMVKAGIPTEMHAFLANNVVKAQAFQQQVNRLVDKHKSNGSDFNNLVEKISTQVGRKLVDGNPITCQEIGYLLSKQEMPEEEVREFVEVMGVASFSNKDRRHLRRCKVTDEMIEFVRDHVLGEEPALSACGVIDTEEGD